MSNPRQPDVTDVVVIGAGQAGLSAGYFLRRSGLEFVMLDADAGPGGAWQHRWPTMRYGAAHRIHPLPGMPLQVDDELQPAAEVVSRYFAAYERQFGLDVRRPVRVGAVHLDGPDTDFQVVSDAGEVWASRAVINATGTWTHPFWPRYPGMSDFRGRQLHTADYRGPDEFAGLRVVVVGGGTSGVQLLLEIAPVAAATTWVTRRPPAWHSGPFDAELAHDAVGLVEARVRAGLTPGSVVSVTGLGLTPAVLAAQASGTLDRRPMFARLTRNGVAWSDGRTEDVDVILWCTGFRAALNHLAPLHLRGPGGGIVMTGDASTQVAGWPRLHLIGYGPSASTIGANRAGRVAVRELRRTLADLTVGTGSPSQAR